MKRARITKRPYTYKGKTEERWLTQWTDLKGVRREKWFRNKRHASAYANKTDKDLAENIHVADRASVTFGKACEAWLKDCERRHQPTNRSMTGATLVSYRRLAASHTMPRFEHIKLSKIATRDVQAAIDDLATTHAGSTCCQVHGVIWNVFEFAIKHDLGIVRNPLKDKRVTLPKRRKKTADDIPSFEEVRDLLIYLHQLRPTTGKRVYKLMWTQRLVMVALAAFGGLRAGECAGLDWKCVDLVRRTIKVEKSFSRQDGLKGPKSPSGNRDVPMNPILHNIMTRYGDLVGRNGPVFKDNRAGRRSYDTFGRQLKEAQNGAGVPKRNFHALRHFAGSAWLAQGMRIQDVSWLLGHSDIKTTMGTYAHQLKGDDHARQVLNEQVTRFPGIPHSLVEITSSTETLPAPLPNQLPDLLPAPDISVELPSSLYQPSPVASTAPMEVVPTVNIPPEAPQYVGYAVRLLQSGWYARDVAKELGYDQSRLWKVFNDWGLDSPKKIRLAATWARAQYMSDNGFSQKQIARICGVTVDAVSRKIGHHRPGSVRGADRSSEKRPPRLLRCEKCAKEFKWDKPGGNKRFCDECKNKHVVQCQGCGKDYERDAPFVSGLCLECKNDRGNEIGNKPLKTNDNLASSEPEKRENCREMQLTLWKT